MPSTQRLALASAILGGSLGLTWLIAYAPSSEVHTLAPDAPTPSLHLDGAPSYTFLSDGSLLNLDVATPSRESLTLDARFWLESAAEPSEAVVFTFDMSASTWVPGEGCGGDFDADGLSDTVLDCELASILASIDEMAGWGSVQEVGLIPFYSQGAIADVRPTGGRQPFTSPTADLNSNGTLDLEEVLRSVGRITTLARGVRRFSLTQTYSGFGGGTNFRAAAAQSCTALGSTSQPVQTIVFLSDGEATFGGDVTEVLPCSEPVTIQTVAVGSDSGCDLDATGRGSLAEIAELGGGVCTQVLDPADLADVLGGAVVPQITGLTLSVDGGPAEDVSAYVTDGLPHRGEGELALSLPISSLTGDHTLCLTATAVEGLSGTPFTVTECVSTASNEAPVADAGIDHIVAEGALVTLDGTSSSDPDGDALTHVWEISDQDGPLLVIPGAIVPSTAVQTLDDGAYTFTLTVSDGELESSDTVTVTVTNEAPVAEGRIDGAATDGIVLLTTSFTDAGPLDTHTATVDWGDGSAPQEVDISAQGTGWGSLYASHTYPNAGTYSVTATITDDDGGTSTVPLSVTISRPVAIWASGTSGDAIDWTGGSGTVEGLSHSNAGIRVRGSSKSLAGRVEYVTSASLGSNTNVTTEHVSASGPPITYSLADYSPGGRAAIEAGSDFHDRSGSCSGSKWQVSGTLAAGLYYASCDIKLLAPQSEATFATPGEIQVASQGTNLRPFTDGLLFIAGKNGRAIEVAASGGTYLGHLVANDGTIQLTGSVNRFLCGIIAEEVDISGAGLDVRAADCVRPDRTTAPPTLVPVLSVALTNDAEGVSPSEAVTSAVTLENASTRLLVPGIVGLENHGTTPITVTSASIGLEVLEVDATAWTSLPDDVALHTTSNAATGVSYDDALVGTTLAGGSLASWGAELQADLPAETVAWLLDEAQVRSVRTRVEFTVDDATAPVRSLYRFGDDIAEDLREQGASLTGLEVTLTTVDGTTRVLDVPGDGVPATLGAGESFVVAADGLAPAAAPIGDSESAQAYLTRLRALDGAGLGALATARAEGGVGLVLGSQEVARSALAVPVLTGAYDLPATAIGGRMLAVDVQVANTSTATAEGVAATLEIGGSTGAAEVTSTLLAGELDYGTVAVSVPLGLAGSYTTATSTTSWLDVTGGAYGPVPGTAELFVDVPPALSAAIGGGLYTDADANGVVTPGDTLRYTLTIQNTGSVAVEGLVVTAPLDPNTRYVVGTASTTAGTVTAASDNSIAAAVGTLVGFETATLSWDVSIVVPLASDVATVSAYGTVASADLVPVTTEPLITPMVTDAPVLVAYLHDELHVDADADGGPSAGDTLRYLVLIENPGLVAASDVVFTLTPAVGSTLVAGTVETDTATVVTGNGTSDTTVRLEIPALEGQATSEHTFEVLVTGGGGATLSAQGSVVATEIDAFVTDDPTTDTPDDATLTPLGGVVSGTDAATVLVSSPADGARIGAPIEVVASAETVGGAGVTSWRVLLAASDDDEGTVLASGAGDLPATLTTFDPTLLENGLWTLRVEVTDDLGRVGVGEAAVVVAGDMKLGAYDVAFVDAEWHSSVTQISLLRSYSTLRKDTVGDFGHGWRLSMLDMRIQRNGPLGEGGWRQEACGTGFIYYPVCTVTDDPHLVVVRWPDGRTEAFDITPTEGSSYFAELTAAAFTPRAGATSTLEPADGASLFYYDGKLYDGLTLDTLYDPQQYWLTDRTGVMYLLDVDEGLLEIIDRHGNTVTVNDDGILPNRGEGVGFLRDANGRIEEMTLPDGATITYAYDSDGDLVSATDGNGAATEFDYDADHRLVAYNVDGRAPVAQLTYDSDGRLVSSEDAAGVLVTRSADLDAFEQIIIGPDPRLTTTTGYDQDGQPSSIVQDYVDEQGVPQSLATFMSWDDDFRMATRALPSGAEESWTYDDESRILSHEDAAGVLRTWEYGPFGQVRAMTEGGETVEETAFGVDDLPETVYRGDGTVLRRMTWDATGLLTSVENGTGQILVFDNDTDGQLESITLPDFDGQLDIIDVLVDGRGQLASFERNYPNGRFATSFGYDGNGNRTSLTDPHGNVMRFTWDTFGRMLTHTDKAGKTVSTTWDETGRELTRTNRNGEVLTRTYDDAGRLATMSGPGVDREFRYDPLGRPVYMREGAHVEQRIYDGVDLVGTRVYGTDDAGYADVAFDLDHDPAARLVGLDGAGTTVAYSYDARGRLVTTSEATLGLFTFGYDAAGRMASLARPNAATTILTYDDAGQPLAYTTGLVHEILTTYDDRALPETQTDHEGTHRYEHDIGGRLAGVDHPAGAATADESYSYDVADRRTSGGAVYDNGDRLTEDAKYTYAYDEEGRRISRTNNVTGEVTSYGYNVLDKLISLEEGGTTWTFTYDARDLRVLVTAQKGGTETYGEAFVYDVNGNVRASYDTAGNLTVSYLTGLGFGEVLAKVDALQPTFALRDRQGTTVGWVDEVGAVAELSVRDGYGVRALAPTQVVPYGYTGHAEDPTGLAWGRARYYDAAVGAWMSEDPQWLEPRYCYARGAPGHVQDPSGMGPALEYPLLWAALGCHAGGGLAMIGGLQGRYWAGARDPGGPPVVHDYAGGCIGGAIAGGAGGVYGVIARDVFFFVGGTFLAAFGQGWASASYPGTGG